MERRRALVQADCHRSRAADEVSPGRRLSPGLFPRESRAGLLPGGGRAQGGETAQAFRGKTEKVARADAQSACRGDSSISYGRRNQSSPWKEIVRPRPLYLPAP